MKLTKEERFGVVSSVIFLLIFTVLLFVFGFSIPSPQEEEGILINFGTSEIGSGMVEPSPASQPIESEPEPIEESTPPPTPSTASEEAVEEVNTQDFEEAAALAEKKKKQEEDENRKKQEEENERKKQEEQERENARIEKERIEKQQREEEKRLMQEQKQRELDERARNAFGGQNPTGDNTGEGEGDSQGNQGDTDGDINSTNRTGGSGSGNGPRFDLDGRSSKSLPPPPTIHTTDGKVVVEVTVDRNGNVVSARPGVKGSTISDASLLKVAKEAAMKAKFNIKKDAQALQKGTITYFFGFE